MHLKLLICTQQVWCFGNCVGMYSFNLILIRYINFYLLLFKYKTQLFIINRRTRQSWPVDGSPMLQADEYMLPYANLVGHDPSVEDMRVILNEGTRPAIPIRWKFDKVSINKFDIKLWLQIFSNKFLKNR